MRRRGVVRGIEGGFQGWTYPYSAGSWIEVAMCAVFVYLTEFEGCGVLCGVVLGFEMLSSGFASLNWLVPDPGYRR